MTSAWSSLFLTFLHLMDSLPPKKHSLIQFRYSKGCRQHRSSNIMWLWKWGWFFAYNVKKKCCLSPYWIVSEETEVWAVFFQLPAISGFAMCEVLPLVQSTSLVYRGCWCLSGTFFYRLQSYFFTCISNNSKLKLRTWMWKLRDMTCYCSRV